MLRIVAYRHRRQGGFTIIEALVALAVVASSLAAIGSLIAATTRGARSLEQRVALLQTARAVETGLPGRDQLVPGSSGGEIAGHRWRVSVSPFAAEEGGRNSLWIPQLITTRVQSPSGAVIELNTARIRLRAKQ
ncbi:MAG: type IV pilus modification PilV family protein [Afipia sp.]